MKKDNQRNARSRNAGHAAGGRQAGGRTGGGARSAARRESGLHGFLIGQTETLLAEILKFTGPADATTSRFFRAHPKLGHSERGIIAEAVFAVLRRRMEFAHLAGRR